MNQEGCEPFPQLGIAGGAWTVVMDYVGAIFPYA
jgi:hypothetical protein